jgi:hypothetical protein
VRMRLGVDKARAGGVEQVLGEVPSNSHDARDEQSKGFGGGSKVAAGGQGKGRRGGAVGRETRRPFISASLGVTAG